MEKWFLLNYSLMPLHDAENILLLSFPTFNRKVWQVVGKFVYTIRMPFSLIRCVRETSTSLMSSFYFILFKVLPCVVPWFEKKRFWRSSPQQSVWCAVTWKKHCICGLSIKKIMQLKKKIDESDKSCVIWRMFSTDNFLSLTFSPSRLGLEHVTSHVGGTSSE